MLQNVRGAKGARSISDLARGAILQLMDSNGQTDGLSEEVRELQNRVRLIAIELERIAPLAKAATSAGTDGIAPSESVS